MLVVDHIHPVSRGGRDNLDNLITACETCNQGKGANVIPDISEMREYQTAALMAVQWLVDVWCQETGDEIDWMPNPSLYLAAIKSSSAWSEATDLIEMTAYMAKTEGVSPEEALQWMWERTENRES